MSEPFYITQEQFDTIALAQASSTTNRVAMYEEVYQAVLGDSALPDANGTLVQAEGNVQAWFGAAVEANGGSGPASDLIRTYTQVQIEIRSGQPMADPVGQIQDASNAIADQVFLDIQNSATVINGETYYIIPDALQIGGVDATEAVQSLGVDIAVWSGNPLFVGLGSEQFWVDNILTDESDTYDLFVAVAALTQAGYATLGGITQLLAQFASQGSGGIAGAVQAIAAANNATEMFLDQAYDLGSIPYGTVVTSNLTLGSDGNDSGLVSNGFSSDTFMHGGLGNDLLVGSVGNDVLDGGAGEDSVGFEDVSLFGGSGGERLNLTATIFSKDSAVPFSALVTGENLSSHIYDVEGLALGLGDDILEIVSLSADNTSLKDINAAGEGDLGDTIDLSMSDSGGEVSLTNNSLSVAGINTVLNVYDFENVIGSEFKDNIDGDDGTEGNIIDGRGGKDVINGGDGDDRLLGGDDVDVLRGDGGDDIIEGQEGNDRSFGGAGDDLIFASEFLDVTSTSTTTDRIWGGAGDDILVGSIGIDTLRGQGGDDLLIGGEGADILEGGGGRDYIIAGAGQDQIWGGKGNDFINALGSNATVFVDAQSGRDFIKQGLGDTPDTGVSEIVFEGLLADDVELIWDYESLYSEGDLEYDLNDPFFEPLESELYHDEGFGGEAVLRVKSTGASINIGYVEGSLYQEITFEEIDIGMYEEINTSYWFIDYVNLHALSFDDVSSAEGDFFQLVNQIQVVGGSDDGMLETTGLLGFDDVIQSTIGAYDNAPGQFLNNFENDYADIASLSAGERDIAEILMQDTIDQLTVDAFVFA